jgi:all-trans-retinol dehydrogenase (NAD+)
MGWRRQLIFLFFRSTTFINNLAHQPALTAALLIALQLGYLPLSSSTSTSSLSSRRGGGSLLRRITSLRPETLRTVLSVLLGAGLARTASNLLDQRAANNGQLAAHEGWDWPSEVAVVTGGSNGIGEAIARSVAGKGIKVAVLDVVQPSSQLLASHPHITFFECDVSSPMALSSAAASIRQHFGRDPSILVNNAGVGGSHLIMQTPPELLTKTFHSNIMAHWLTVQEFLPAMLRADKGHVVIIASIGAFTSMMSLTDYAATKAGVVAFTEGLRDEIKLAYKTRGVLTSLVIPAWVRTTLIEPNTDEIEDGHGPLLSVDDVGDLVARQILARTGAQVFLPSGYSWVASVRCWPLWVQDAFRKMLVRAVVPPR